MSTRVVNFLLGFAGFLAMYSALGLPLWRDRDELAERRSQKASGQ